MICHYLHYVTNETIIQLTLIGIFMSNNIKNKNYLLIRLIQKTT